MATELTAQDWADHCYIEQLAAEGRDDFRFEITAVEEPEMGCTHLVCAFDWRTGDLMESFTTDDPYGAVEAGREAQTIPLEERLAMYAEMGL